MRSPITRLAAAAVVIIATVIAMSRFGGSTGGVVWAEVVRNVEASPDFIFRMKQIYNDQETGTKEFHMTVYGSVEYGMRMDGYLDPEHPSQTYGSLKEEAVISVTHSSKTYARMPLTADQLAEFEKLDVKRSIRKYVSGGYKKLGRRTIEGVEAEGIEVDDPSEAKATFPVDSFVMQLWVAVDTGLPVLMEAHTMGKNGTLEVHTVQDNFQWNVDLDEGEFLPDIPEDYSQMEVEIDAEGRTTFKTPVTHDAQEEAGAKIQKWRFRDKHPEQGYRLLSEDGQSATNIPESWADSPEHAVRIREELDHLERQAKRELVEVKKIEVNGQLDYRILMPGRQNRVLRAIDDHCRSGKVETLPLRRAIMRNPITRVAAAAVIIFAAMICVSQISESIDGQGIVFAEVRQAFLAESWVHLQYDNDTESWYNLITGDHCHKQLYPWGDSFFYFNRTDNLHWRYTPERGQHITEGRGTLYKDNIIPPYEPETAWERIVEQIAEQPGKYHQVQTETDTLDGKTVIRFDIYYIDAMKKRLLTKQLWADTQTKLPIKIRKKLTSQERKDQNREYMEGVFSFPETGPSSIYDLGVPRDLPVAKDYGQAADPAIKEIFEMAKQYYENFPKRCRAVTWENDRESEIMVVWRDGEKVRLHIYFNLVRDKYPQYHLDVPTTVDEILTWAKTQPPIAIYLDDEEKFYDRSYHPAFESTKTPKTRIKRSRRWALPIEANFIEEHWDYCINRNPDLLASRKTNIS